MEAGITPHSSVSCIPMLSLPQAPGRVSRLPGEKTASRGARREPLSYKGRCIPAGAVSHLSPAPALRPFTRPWGPASRGWLRRPCAEPAVCLRPPARPCRAVCGCRTPSQSPQSWDLPAFLWRALGVGPNVFKGGRRVTAFFSFLAVWKIHLPISETIGRTNTLSISSPSSIGLMFRHFLQFITSDVSQRGRGPAKTGNPERTRPVKCEQRAGGVRRADGPGPALEGLLVPVPGQVAMTHQGQ